MKIVISHKLCIDEKQADAVFERMVPGGCWIDFAAVTVVNSVFADFLIQRFLVWRDLASPATKPFMGFRNVSVGIISDLGRSAEAFRRSKRAQNLAFPAYDDLPKTHYVVGSVQDSILRGYSLVRERGSLTAAEYRDEDDRAGVIATYSTYLKIAYDMGLLRRDGVRNEGYRYYLPEV